MNTLSEQISYYEKIDRKWINKLQLQFQTLAMYIA